MQEPCLVVEPQRQEMHSRGEHSLRGEILQLCDKLFTQFQIKRVFFEKKIPVDTRHNAKIHRLALARKWSRYVARKPGSGKLS